MVRFSAKKRKPTGVLAVEKPPVGPLSEYRNLDDDAWYSVFLGLKDETLVVKYREFPEEQDKEFHAVNFDTPNKIMELRKRFRPLSEQLESNGSDCRRVQVGTRVCAIRNYGVDARHFYDAFVEAVSREDHIVVNGAVECSCSFVVTWLHGPLAGKQTIARTEDLCLIKSHEGLDPRAVCFFKIVEWKHGIVSVSPCAMLFNDDVLCNPLNPAPSSKQKAPFITQALKDRSQDGRTLFSHEEYVGFEREEDVDLGGRGSSCAYVRDCDSQRSIMVDDLVEDVSNNGLERVHTKNKSALEEASHFILVENLEKDISPVAISKFFKKSACVEVEAFVFLSLSSDPYLRAALVVESVEELEKLCDFITKPSQMIISSRGRPWIVCDSAGPELVRPSFWCLEQDDQNEKEQSSGDELKVVQSDSEEYSKAMKLRDLFLEFAHHQQTLVSRLMLEEQSILEN